jgi:2-dehydropantoate 2-reductase
VKVAVFGGGAVGLGLSSCLLSSGVDLHLHVRDAATRDALHRDGLARTGIFGDVHAAPGDFSAGCDPAEIAAASPDFVLVCTKTTARDEVAQCLADLWPKLAEPAVVLCANGWGLAEHFATLLPASRIFNATVTTGFRRQGPTRVEITVHGDDIHMGSLFGAGVLEIAPLCTAIADGGIACASSLTMERDLWAKLLYNCALNPLAALLGVPYGAIGDAKETRAILEAVVGEIFDVIAARGGRTHWASADEYLAFFFGELLPPTRDHESSMLQDLRAGRPTEIDTLCGAVVALGDEADVAVPVNDALATLVGALHPTA